MAGDSNIRVGHFEADGALINLPLGFIPDYFQLVDFHTDTNIEINHWWERMEDDQASGKQEGFSVKEGVTANLADAGGITAYNTGSQSPTVNEWTTARATAATARSGTAAGTFIKPTVGAVDDTGGVADRDAIFECVTAGTGLATEPAWPSAIGGQVLDSSVLWEKVNEATLRIGYQGVVIAAALMTDGQECYYLALKAHDSVDHGDVVGWTNGIDQDWT